MNRYPFVITFIPISMGERSENGTSLVTNSHINIAKLHMSADLWSTSSGLFCSTKTHHRLLLCITRSHTNSNVITSPRSPGQFAGVTHLHICAVAIYFIVLCGVGWSGDTTITILTFRCHPIRCLNLGTVHERKSVIWHADSCGQIIINLKRICYYGWVCYENNDNSKSQ